MPKLTTRVDLACPAERVWRLVTDLDCWSWRSGLTRILTMEDGRHFVDRWYALDIANDRLFGRCEALFISTERGTRAEFTAEVWMKGPFGELAAKSWLLRRQRRYVTDLRRALEVK